MSSITPTTAQAILDAIDAASLAYRHSPEQVTATAQWAAYRDAGDAMESLRQRVEKAEQALTRASVAYDKAYAALHKAQEERRPIYHAAQAAEQTAQASPARAALDAAHAIALDMTGERDLYDAQYKLGTIVQEAKMAAQAATVEPATV